MAKVHPHKRYLAVISAKARSTRFPGKNKSLLAGKPLVVHAIEIALQSGLFDSVTVSTDEQSIADLALAAGAQVPFIRDPALSKDTVEVPAVARNVVEWYQKRENKTFDWLCLLQPTSPLRTVDDLIGSLKRVEEVSDADAVISISKYHHHPYWALRAQGNSIVPDRPEFATASRQRLPDLYHPDGTVYWWRVTALLSSLNIHDGKVTYYRTPASSVLDIDYPVDLEYAKWRLS